MDDDRKADTGQKVRLWSLDDLDNRTTSARRARDLVAAITSDLGGDPSAAQSELVQRAATIGAYLQDCEVKWLSGELPDTGPWFQAIALQTRVLLALGLERRQRDVTTLSDYLARKERN